MEIEQIKDFLKTHQNNKRYNHSLCVADEAKRLANIYGADENKMYLAGLLHDITKNFDPQEQLTLIKNGGIILTVDELNVTGIWHALSGYVYLRDVMGITDTDILLPVRYHTTGKADMTLCEKIIFIADLTSAERDYDDVEKVRQLVNNNLDEAIIYVLKFTLKKLINIGLRIHQDTIDAYNFLIDNKKN